MIAGTIASWVMFLASLFVVSLQVWALADCLVAKPVDFLRAGKRTKPMWLILTALSVVVGLGYVTGSGGGLFLLLNVVACVIAGVYLTDVRPEVRQFRYQGGR